MSRVVSILSAVNPVSALFGPIFQKDVRIAGRRRSTYVMRALYCVGLLLMLVGAYLVYREEFSSPSAVIHLQSMQKLAPKLTLAVAWFQFGILFLAAPVLAAGSICDERRARSLDVLMTTPLRAGQIVLGKLSSRIAQVVILALLAAPSLLAVRVLGGLSAEVVLATTAVAISTAVLGAALAVAFSMRQKRGTMAALFGVLSLLLLQMGPALVEGIRYQVANEWVILSPYRTNILVTCSPSVMQEMARSVENGVPLPRLILFQPAAGKPGTTRLPVDVGPMWALNAGYNLIMACFITLLTTMALRRAMTRTEVREQLLGRGGATVEETVEEAVEEAPPAEPEATEAKEETTKPKAEKFATRDREVKDNPVLWREVRQPTFGSRKLFRVIVALTVVAMAFLYWQAGLSHEGLHGALAFIACGAILFQAVFLTSGPYAGEREARTWETLLTTTLTPGQILRGKFLGALRGFWFIPAVVAADFVAASVMGYIRPIGVLYLVLILAGPALFLTASGHLLSLRFKKAVTAGALNLAIALTLWALLWLSLLVLPLILRVFLTVPDALGILNSDLVIDGFLDDHFMHVVDGIYALNPVALMDTAVNPCILETGPRGTVHGPFETGLIHHRLNMGQCTLVVLSVFGFYATGAAAMLGFSRLGFMDWSGRVS